MKGRDAGAQVSSSTPEPGGVGARTSGSGECPFGDVRSPSAAPRSLPVSRPRRPLYSGAQHLSARTCPLTAERPLVGTAASGRQPRILWGLPAPGGRARTAPPPFVSEESPSARGSRQAFADRFCRSPVLFPSALRLSPRRRGRFVYSGDQICKQSTNNFFFASLGDLKTRPPGAPRLF